MVEVEPTVLFEQLPLEFYSFGFVVHEQVVEHPTRTEVRPSDVGYDVPRQVQTWATINL